MSEYKRYIAADFGEKGGVALKVKYDSSGVIHILEEVSFIEYPDLLKGKSLLMETTNDLAR